jgi:hypothetical protein
MMANPDNRCLRTMSFRHTRTSSELAFETIHALNQAGTTEWYCTPTVEQVPIVQKKRIATVLQADTHDAVERRAFHRVLQFHRVVVGGFQEDGIPAEQVLLPKTRQRA